MGCRVQQQGSKQRLKLQKVVMVKFGTKIRKWDAEVIKARWEEQKSHHLSTSELG